ncbi:hypothetical protein KHU32_14040 [Roseococcus sp. XZZS9]|uniref:Uncharacterized protein n=2 Tax=Roseococcus pinisoli TaxID=2835040 RepID=A0ABS5QF08_9PROT|nr:hypothetical protein [Roseococcus pinisoli]
MARSPQSTVTPFPGRRPPRTPPLPSPGSDHQLPAGHPLDLLLWSIELMVGAAAIHAPKRRQVQMRDGLLVAGEVLRGARLTNFLNLRLGDDLAWGPRTKWRIRTAGNPQEAHVASNLCHLLHPWIDRYMHHERAELLGTRRCNAIWVTWSGDPIGEIGFDRRLRWWSGHASDGRRSFGAVDLRASVLAHAPLLDPRHPQLLPLLSRLCEGAAGNAGVNEEDVALFRQQHAAAEMSHVALEPALQGSDAASD